MDYRVLKANTIFDIYPIPAFDDIPDYLRGSVIFSKIDLAQGYHWLRVAKGYKHRTEF